MPKDKRHNPIFTYASHSPLGSPKKEASVIEQSDAFQWEYHEGASIAHSLLKIVFSQKMNPDTTDSQKTEQCTEWKKEADEGIRDAQYLVGECYEVGLGVVQSYTHAAHYYTMAAEQEDTTSMLRLSFFYLYGNGVKQSDEKAVALVKLAVEHGDNRGLALLGKFYEEGKGLPHSLAEAIKYYKLSAEAGNILGYEKLANAYAKGIGVERSQELSDKYYQIAFQMHKDSADAGDSYSQFTVGKFFEQGRGIDQSFEQAFHYYQLAANQKEPHYLYQLGHCFEKGIGIEKSEDKALYYYQQSAEQGFLPAHFSLALLLNKQSNFTKAFQHWQFVSLQGSNFNSFLVAKAQHYLGEYYESGLGVIQSSKNALRYYGLAAENGDISSLISLGNAYHHGTLGVEQSDKKAFQFFKQAADQGDSEGQILTGECYEEGIGVNPSLNKALNYYNLAAEQNNFYAYNKLAEAYSKAKNIKNSKELSDKFYQKEFQFYKDDADKGDVNSQFLVGLCYEEGKGVVQSIDEAFYYYSKGADQNNDECILKLGRFYEEGLSVEKSTEKAIYYYKLSYQLGNIGALYRLAIQLDVQKDYLEAFSYWKLLEKTNEELERDSRRTIGYADTLFNLAHYYRNGLGVEKSDLKAIHYYKVAAQKGDIDALWALGTAYIEGQLGLKEAIEKGHCYFTAAVDGLAKTEEKEDETSVNFETLINTLDDCSLTLTGYFFEIGITGTPNLREAAHYYLLAANKDYPLAHYLLGKCYEEGKGVAKSERRAKLHLKQALDKGVDAFEAHFRLAIDLSKRNYPEEAFQQLEFLSKLPDCPQALKGEVFLSLGNFYRLVKGEKQNLKKAIVYYKLAARLGDLNALNLLGDLYHGESDPIVHKCYKKAVYYYTKSAERGDPYGQVSLGECYEKGHGVEASYETAFYYYLNAAKKGNGFGLYKVGWCYQYGFGVQKSLKEAIKYYTQAAEQGRKSAYKQLAQCILEENGPEATEKYHHYLELAGEPILRLSTRKIIRAA